MFMMMMMMKCVTMLRVEKSINQSIHQSNTILSCAQKLTRELANFVCST